MEEPLLQTVPRRAFLGAIDSGLEQWLEQEKPLKGKKDPAGPLTTAALQTLEPAIARIRERARDLTLVAVLMTNDQIAQRVTDRPGNVRYRLGRRLGSDVPKRRYVEVPTEAGPLLVRPLVELLGRTGMRISADIRYWDEKYRTLGSVRSEPPLDVIDTNADPPGSPRFRSRLSERARELYRIAREEPGVAKLVKRFLEEELTIAVDRLKNLLGLADRERTVEVFRLGRIEIVEVGVRAIAGGGVAAVFEEHHTESKLERIEGTPDVAAIMRDMAAYETTSAGEAVDDLFDVMAATYAHSEEIADQGAFVNRASGIGLSAVRPLAAYLQQGGAIDDADAWIEEQGGAIVAARRSESLHGAYHAQAARRRRGKNERVTFLEKQLALIAARELPQNEADPETAIIRAARDGVALYARRPVFVPPLDQFVDNSLTWILLAARTLDRVRKGDLKS